MGSKRASNESSCDFQGLQPLLSNNRRPYDLLVILEAEAGSHSPIAAVVVVEASAVEVEVQVAGLLWFH